MVQGGRSVGSESLRDVILLHVQFTKFSLQSTTGMSTIVFE